MRFHFFALVVMALFILSPRPYSFPNQPPQNTVPGNFMEMMDPAGESAYYVDYTGGSDSNEGRTPSTPLKTIAELETKTLLPGTIVYFKRGETWRDQLTVTDAGTAAQPIAFTAYGTGDRPVITGADEITGMTYVDPYATKAAITTEPDHVFYDDVRLTENDGATTTVALNEWDWATDTLYINVGEDPAGGEVEATQRNTAITVNGDAADYLNFSEITVEGGMLYGFLVIAADYITLDDMLFQKNDAAGFQVYDVTHNTNVTYLTIQNSTSRDNYQHGISFLDDFDHITITNNEIYDNAVYDPSAVISGIYMKDDGLNVVSSDITVTDNLIHDNGTTQGRGLYFDTLADDGSQTAAYNEIYDNAGAGFVVEKTSGVNIHYNLIYGNGQQGISFWNDVSDSEVYNNTIYGNDSGVLFADVTGSCDDNLVKNNLIVDNIGGSGDIALYIHDKCANNGGSGNVYQYNGLGEESAIFVYWDGAYKATYDAWETAYCGSDGCSNSVETDPSFTNAPGDDFTLQEGSTAIEAGTDVALTEDILGNAIVETPDLGAYEYQWSCAYEYCNSFEILSTTNCVGEWGWPRATADTAYGSPDCNYTTRGVSDGTQAMFFDAPLEGIDFEAAFDSTGESDLYISFDYLMHTTSIAAQKSIVYPIDTNNGWPYPWVNSVSQTGTKALQLQCAGSTYSDWIDVQLDEIYSIHVHIITDAADTQTITVLDSGGELVGQETCTSAGALSYPIDGIEIYYQSANPIEHTFDNLRVDFEQIRP